MVLVVCRVKQRGRSVERPLNLYRSNLAAEAVVSAEGEFFAGVILEVEFAALFKLRHAEALSDSRAGEGRR